MSRYEIAVTAFGLAATFLMPWPAQEPSPVKVLAIESATPRPRFCPSTTPMRQPSQQLPQHVRSRHDSNAGRG